LSLAEIFANIKIEVLINRAGDGRAGAADEDLIGERDGAFTGEGAVIDLEVGSNS
jgi:hypothetical protein